ncbi:MAG: anti-sigma factor antagonist [Planctomycetes bacterium]|nr:anti-sigma factor antagonist [Planctomycetota bacterium]
MARVELTVPSDAAELKRIRAFANAVCESVGAIDGRTALQIELAVHEAASNIMEHAYGGCTDREITVEADASDNAIEFRLYHCGKMFECKAPRPDPSPETGYGLYLMGQCMDEVRYFRAEDGRACTCLVKKLHTRGKKRCGMEPAVEQVGDVLVVTPLTESLEIGNADEFSDAVTPIIRGKNKVVFDMSKLCFVDSSGLKAIIWCIKQLDAVDGDLKLCGLTEQVRSLFEIARMHKIIDIFDTREQAVEAFQKK